MYVCSEPHRDSIRGRGATQVLRSEDPKRTFELYASLTVQIAERYAALPAAPASSLSSSSQEEQQEPLVSLEVFNSKIDALLKEEFRVQTVFGLMLSQVRPRLGSPQAKTGLSV